MTQTDLREVSVVSDLYEPDLVVLEPKIEDAPASTVHTYHSTRWPFVNQLLDVVDSVTHGRAGQIQRFVSFAFLGGIASIVNLVVLYVTYYHSSAALANANVRYIVAFLLASEVSIIVNFSLNDYFTFRHLPGHARSWIARCGRFHMTSISAIILTFLIGFGLHSGLGVHPMLSQAIAILIVLFYNFTIHHVFTYRRIKTAVAN
ncbi:MAG: GtrA family protein [Ktedonobacteraceae bacterium]|nr:GtrA family protein [Ktedonobacteraceae bacterium]